MAVKKRSKPFPQSNLRETIKVWVEGEQDYKGIVSYEPNIPFLVKVKVSNTTDKIRTNGKTPIENDFVVSTNPLRDRKGVYGPPGSFVLPIRTERAIAFYGGDYYDVVQIADNNQINGEASVVKYAFKRTNIDVVLPEPIKKDEES